jgi:hypothetical protein
MRVLSVICAAALIADAAAQKSKRKYTPLLLFSSSRVFFLFIAKRNVEYV